MRHTVKTWLMGGTVCMAMLAAACGANGDGDAVSDEGKPYAASLEKNLTTGGEGEVELSDEQAGCIAPKWVNTMKPDRLKKAGIKPADLAKDDNMARIVKLKLSNDEGSALVDAFGDCGVDLKDSFLAADSSLTDGDKKCLSDAISDDLLKKLLVVGFTKGPDAFTEDKGIGKEFTDATKKCPGTID